MYQILLCDDEKDIVTALEIYLRNDDYKIFKAYNGADALKILTEEEIHLVLLDIMMPHMDGIAALTKLREFSNVPVILLTAKSEDIDKVLGLTVGADDYITKPFGTSELLARIRALSRRQGEVILEELTFDDLTLNLSSNDLSCKNKSIHLGYKEFEILKILMSNPKILISKETLIVKVWGAESAAESNNVEAYISFLRKKFHYLDSKVTIGTVRKVGYRMESEETS